MNVLIVDTSSWISFFRGEKSIEIDEALHEGRVVLSPIVAAELLSGDVSGRKRVELIDFLRELPLTNQDFDHWLAVGALRFKLFKRGLSVSTPDAHIAQSCLDLNCYLITQDKIFRQITELKDYLLK